MSNSIKISLAELGKKQVDLLEELKKRGYKTLYPTQLSNYINGRESGPQANAVKATIYEIINYWKHKDEG